jgi:hypothetical protein
MHAVELTQGMHYVELLCNCKQASNPKACHSRAHVIFVNIQVIVSMLCRKSEIKVKKNEHAVVQHSHPGQL